MKKLFIFIIALAISLSVNAQSYDNLWKEFDDNIENLLPESANKTLDKIEKQAKKDKNQIQFLKMIIKRCEVFNITEENPIDTIIKYCEKQLPNLSSPCDMLLNFEIVSNKALYYIEDEYKLDTIIDYRDADYLKNISMKDYAVLFEGKDKTFDIDLEPTLYDYAMHQNIKQYKSIRDRKNADDCYQILMDFDLENNYQKAYFNNKFDCLGGLYNENDFEKYNKFEQECTDNEILVRIKLEKMHYYLNKKEYLAASGICDEILSIIDKKHPVYNDCLRLKENIFKKTIRIKMCEVQVPDKPIAVGLTYRNTTNPTYKIYKFTSAEFFNLLNNSNKDFYKSLKNYKLATSGTIEIPEEKDFLEHSSLVALPPLKIGFYVLVFSNCDKFDDEKNLESIPFQVSNLTSFDLKSDGVMNLFTINRETSQPIANVTAHIYKKSFNHRSNRYEQTDFFDIVSDKDGHLTYDYTENNSFYIDLYCNGDTLIDNSQHYIWNSHEEESHIYSYIYTDRDLYRPGQTVQFKGVVMKNVNGENHLLPDYETQVDLYDPNSNIICTQRFKTDDFGAFSGSFTLPTNCLNGYFHLSWQTFFRVEEYKRPTFEVLFDDIEKEYKIGDSVTVNGKVMALSGFGLGNIKYKYTISRSVDYPDFRYWGYNLWSNHKYEQIVSGENNTSVNGGFSIDFQILPYKNGRYLHPQLTYKIEVEATSEQGETQSETYLLKASENKYKIDLVLKDNKYFLSFDNNDLKDLKISVNNTIGKPANTRVECKIFKYIELDGYKMDLGTFDRQLLDNATLKENFPYYDFYNLDNPITKELVYQFVTDVNGMDRMFPDNFKLPTGKYEFKLRSTNDTLSVYAQDYFVYDLASKKMPSKAMCWTFVDNYTVYPGDFANYYIGSSEKNVSALVVVMSGDNILKTELITLNNNVYKYSYKVREEDRGELHFQVAFVKHNISNVERVGINVPFDNKMLNITLHTERDKMLPGETDTWSITVKNYKNKPEITSLMAGIYDAALDNLSERNYINRWQLNGLPNKISRHFISSDGTYNKTYRDQYANLSSVVYYWDVSLFSQVGLLPNINYWGYDSKKRITTANYPRVYMDNNNMVEEYVVEQEVLYSAKHEQFDMPTNQAETGNDNNTPQLKIRKDFNETAFFYPNLRTDKNGDCTFTFTMPDALTRWNFRLLAYTKDLKVGNFEKTIVTQQPLMIMADMPRFAYDEDTLWIVANVINSTFCAIKPSAKLEIFDDCAQNVELILSDQIIEMDPIPAGQSHSVRWKVAMQKDINLLTFRFSATTDGFSDAEQHQMPVLSTEVYLTQTYALTAKAHTIKEYDFDINHEGERNHKITLNFNENPLWTAIHAMPYVAEGDEKYAMTAFYRYFVNTMAKQIMESHPEIVEKLESTYKNDTLSELQKYEDLKAIILQETPWVVEAQHEAAQRAAIAKLFDTEAVNDNIASALNLLGQKQTPNGGWSWIDGCPESMLITQYILTGLGQLGCDDSMIEDAFHFIENEVIKDYNKLDTKKKRNKYHCGWTTMRSLYAMSYFDYKTSWKYDTAKRFFVKKLKKDWKHFDFEERAHIALILNRNGEKKAAKKIVQSLREFAIKNELGMYWRDCGLLTETRILEAFNEIDPRMDEIDAMRLWILTQKRTNMWESERASVEAILALVNTGSNWTEDGNVTITVADDYTHAVIDNQSDHVAWGGLYRQYFVPIDKVKQHNDAMTVTRKLVFDNENPNVGDKVKIEITFENSQDMEFVYLKDLRGACFEPKEQLSEYHWDDGMWYYQSTSDVAMEFFFEYLPKGKHTVSYDVYVTKEGSFSAGYSLIQCQYAPEFGAYSNGNRIEIK
jgi:hypothetical protein